MITELEIQNFKCFQEPTSFELSKVNLLTGINGRGKSSLLQVFVILAQSAWKDPTLKHLVINGALMNLGDFDDIKNSNTPRRENIQFNFKLMSPTTKINEFRIEFAEKYEEPLLAGLDKVEITSVDVGEESSNVEQFSELVKRVLS